MILLHCINSLNSKRRRYHTAISHNIYSERTQLPRDIHHHQTTMDSHLHPTFAATTTATAVNDDDDDDGNKPSEKSVETTTSTIPSLSMQCMHVHDVIKEGDGEEVPPGYEIRIAPSSSFTVTSEGDGEQQYNNDDGHDNNGHDEVRVMNEEAKQQEKRPDCSLHVLTEECDDEIVSSIAEHNIDDAAGVDDGRSHVPSLGGAAAVTLPPLPLAALAGEGISIDVKGVEKNVKKGVVSPPGHIYALRRIIVEYEECGGGGGYVDGDDDALLSSPPPPPPLQSVEPSISEAAQLLVPPCTNNDDGAEDKLVVGQMNQEGDGDEEGINALYDAEEDQLFYDAQEDVTAVTSNNIPAPQAMVAETPPDTKSPITTTAIQTPPRSESPPDKVVITPATTKTRKTRIITSQMINISEEENIKLEETSKGTVLCSSEDDDGDEQRCKEGGGEEEWNVGNASESVPTSPLSFSTTTTNNNSNINNNSEEQITVVPYSMARRRMGCNCTKTAENNDDDATNNNGRAKTQKKRRPLKAAYKACQSIKLTLSSHLIRKHSNNNASTNTAGEEYCKECNFFGPNATPKKGTKRRGRNKYCSSSSFRNVGNTIYGEDAVLGNTAEPSEYRRGVLVCVPSFHLYASHFSYPLYSSNQPVNDILSIDSSLGIYVCESGLTSVKCQEIIDAAEQLAYSKGAWSAYTYAKQTLGCKEYDDLAEASEDPVMTACATVRDRLEAVWAATTNNNNDSSISTSSEKKTVTIPAADKPEEENNVDVEDPTKPKKLVLDTREPHVVKYDISRIERQKLDMHTDRSVWTFIIALTEGRGQDYTGGGTFFEKLNATVHLQRGQMLIFRGKLRHRGVKITDGKRYLLVGFLVEPKVRASKKEEKE